MSAGGREAPAPQAIVRCVHPWVTALEKNDASARRFARSERVASGFVRHYEDAAHIIAERDRLPALDGGIAALHAEFEAAKDIRPLPAEDAVAFKPDPDQARWQEPEAAWRAIGPWFWGPRLSLEEACSSIRALLDELS